MDQAERDTLLIRIDERVHNIRKDFKEMKATAEGQEGWGRCQVHAKGINDMEGQIKWFRRTIIGGALAFIGKFTYDLFIK